MPGRLAPPLRLQNNTLLSILLKTWLNIQSFMKAILTIVLLWSSLLASASGVAVASVPDTNEGSQLVIGDKIVLGRTEMVYFPDITVFEGVGMPAKIDTGADSTSISAENIRVRATADIFKNLQGEALLQAIALEFDALTSTKLRDRPDKSDIMVTFDIVHPYTGKKSTLTLPMFRLAMIKSRSGGHLARPVVKMNLQIADKTVSTEVNLVDRSKFSYPNLIGKTFLCDTAWVNAGHDYLQEQSHARIIGRKEHAIIGGLPAEVSISFSNRYSILHAQNITVDEKNRQVSFTFGSSNKQTANMTLPLARKLDFRKASYPMVYVPVQIGKNSFNGYILAYLRDRSMYSSQLRLGSEALNQNFVVNLTRSYLGDKPLRLLSDLSVNEMPLIIGTEESIAVDGIDIVAKPSVTAKTPLLNVSSLKEVKTDKGKEIKFTLLDLNGKGHTLQKVIKKNIKIGGKSRPVIEAELMLGETYLAADVSLALLENKKDEQAKFIVGYGLTDAPVLVNTRSSYALQKTPAVLAGYIEQAQVGDLSFPVKLDTGADITSMNATDMTFFNRNDEKWITFTYSNHDGARQEFTRKVLDEIKIKAREGEKSVPRPVVRMQIKLGDIDEMVDVSLRDRTHFDYSMILGKNFLRHNIIVSSDEQFLLTKKN